MLWNSSPTRNSSSPRTSSTSSTCSRLVSWNSSTITSTNRSRYSPATSGRARSRSRARSSRSLKSSRPRASLSAAYSSPNSRSSSSISTRSASAWTSSAACCTRSIASASSVLHAALRRPHGSQVEQPRRVAAGRRQSGRHRGAPLAAQLRRRALQVGERRRQVGAAERPQLERRADSAQPLVQLPHQPAQPRAAVDRQQVEPGVVLRGNEPLEGPRERVALQDQRLRLGRHAEGRVDAGVQRVGAQHTAAEPVDRRDPGRVDGRRGVLVSDLAQPRRGRGP